MREWLYDKYIVVLENGHKIVSEDWSDPIKKQSEFKFYEIAPYGFVKQE